MPYFKAKVHVPNPISAPPQTPLGGAYSTPPDPVAGFQGGATSK